MSKDFWAYVLSQAYAQKCMPATHRLMHFIRRNLPLLAYVTLIFHIAVPRFLLLASNRHKTKKEAKEEEDAWASDRLLHVSLRIQRPQQQQHRQQHFARPSYLVEMAHRKKVLLKLIILGDSGYARPALTVVKGSDMGDCALPWNTTAHVSAVCL